MQKLDACRQQNQKLGDFERQELEKSNYLLAKAQQQIEEQDDEIKHLNELILYAKCVTIRDSQVDEKQSIAKQRKMEEQRLDEMVPFFNTDGI
jgi:hypothetical protein